MTESGRRQLRTDVITVSRDRLLIPFQKILTGSIGHQLKGRLLEKSQKRVS